MSALNVEYYEDVEDEVFNDDDIFVLSPWGCLAATLKDYGLDISHITPKMGVHMVEDFMESMVTAGYIEKIKE